MKPLKYAILHCLATREGREVTRDEVTMMQFGPARNKNGTYTYKSKVYKSINLLPDEYIARWHIRRLAAQYPGRGWSHFGYEKIQHLSGSWETLVVNNNDNFVDPREVTNGALGINGISRHFAYVGGCDVNMKPKDTRTPAQITSQILLVHEIISQHPNVQWAGHNQFAAKACPSFDVPKWLRSIGVAEKNICQRPLMYKF